MLLGFRLHTSGTRFAILLDKFMESGPSILAIDEVDGFVLTGMSG